MAEEKNKAEKNAREKNEQSNAGGASPASIASLKQQIIKKFGKGSIFSESDDDGEIKFTAESFPTGVLSLDLALGCGGLPKGRIIEIYGPESSGKTTLTLNIIAKCQSLGYIAAFLDAEHALDLNFAKKIGVDLSNLLISQPESGEDCFDICTALIKSGLVNLIVIDSVAALVPKAEIEGSSGDIHVGLQARLMASGLRRITSLAANAGCTIVFINQLRDKIGNMFGGGETTPGGRALKFFSSIRLDVRKIEILKNNDSPCGVKVRVKVTKNKCAMPFKTAELDLLFNEGLSFEGDLIDMALNYGVIEKSGAWYSYNSEKIGQGRENIRNYLKSNTGVCQDIETQVKSMVMA